MKTVIHVEKAKIDKDCEIRIGTSSWDENCISIKYTWFDKNGNAARGGEIPIEALPQMFEVALRRGHIKIS